MKTKTKERSHTKHTGRRAPPAKKHAARAIVAELKQCERSARRYWSDIILADDDLSKRERKRITAALATDPLSQDMRQMALVFAIWNPDAGDADEDLASIEEWVGRMFSRNE